MAQLDYQFSPQYGVEPSNGKGGIDITQDNLVIGVWGLDPQAIPTLVFTELLKPVTENDYYPKNLQQGFAQAMDSRHSALFFLATGVINGPSNVNFNAMVLNPPPEYKQQMVDAVSFNGGDPTDLANYTIKKSLQGNYAWRFTSELIDTVSGSRNAQGVQYGTAGQKVNWYSTYLPLPSTQFGGGFEMAFLKTSGADGVAPQFFDRTTVNGVNEMIEAVNDGDFFIAVGAIYNNNNDNIPGWYQGITWPHSAARG